MHIIIYSIPMIVETFFKRLKPLKSIILHSRLVQTVTTLSLKSVYEYSSENNVKTLCSFPNFVKFCSFVAGGGRGSVFLLDDDAIMLCTSGFMDDVTLRLHTVA